MHNELELINEIHPASFIIPYEMQLQCLHKALKWHFRKLYCGSVAFNLILMGLIVNLRVNVIFIVYVFCVLK